MSSGGWPTFGGMSKALEEWTPADHVAFWKTLTAEDLAAANLTDELEAMASVTRLVEGPPA